jgi:ABC-type multidrug transport system permease subunit
MSDVAEHAGTRQALERPAGLPHRPSTGRRAWSERALVQLALTRFREFIREPEAVFWVFLFPILLAAGLGIAFRHRPPDMLRVGVVTGAPGTKAIADALENDKRLAPQLLADTAAATALRTGRVALVVIPHGDTQNDSVTYRYDDTRPDAASARLIVDDVVQRAAGRRDPMPARDQQVRERGARYIDFLIPGLLGMNLMGSGIWGLGFAIVDARKKKLLKRLVATPMSRTEYLLSFLSQRLMLLVFEVVTLVGFGVIAFGVPLRGSLVELGVIALLSALCFGALGLLISSRTRTTEGVSGLMNLVMLPMWIFSGVFFSSSNFPAAMQPFIQALPLTAVNNALRANMLQGTGLGAMWGEMAIIVAWLVGSFVVALKLFRWK